MERRQVLLTAVVLVLCAGNQRHVAADAALSDFACDNNETRFLLYGVNPAEGFNLQRDVYTRVTELVRTMQAAPGAKRWTLVLPRWNARHWRDKEAGLPWSTFFDLGPLREYLAPVGLVELDDFARFRARCGRGATVDRVLHLIHDVPNNWNRPQPKFNAVDCPQDVVQLYTTAKGTPWKRAVFGEAPVVNAREGMELWSRDLECVKVFGTSTSAHTAVAQRVERDGGPQAVLVGRFEQFMHTFMEVDVEFWRQLTSMQFAEALTTEAARFRDEEIGSSRQILAAHLRRGDFVGSHRTKPVATLVEATSQIAVTCARIACTSVFVATDADETELGELRQLLATELPQHITVFRYGEQWQDGQLRETLSLPGGGWSPGQLAILDQLLCIHADYFIGTPDSTFTYRISEYVLNIQLKIQRKRIFASFSEWYLPIVMHALVVTTRTE